MKIITGVNVETVNDVESPEDIGGDIVSVRLPSGEVVGATDSARESLGDAWDAIEQCAAQSAAVIAMDEDRRELMLEVADLCHVAAGERPDEDQDPLEVLRVHVEELAAELARLREKAAIDRTPTKLTRSVVNQLPLAGSQTLVDGVGVGYVLNVRRDMTLTRAVIVQCDGRLAVVAGNWKHGETDWTQRKPKRFVSTWKFESAHESSRVWAHYQRVCEEASEQIFV